jgi:hypothetical protein
VRARNPEFSVHYCRRHLALVIDQSDALRRQLYAGLQISCATCGSGNRKRAHRNRRMLAPRATEVDTHFNEAFQANAQVAAGDRLIPSSIRCFGDEVGLGHLDQKVTDLGAAGGFVDVVHGHELCVHRIG